MEGASVCEVNKKRDEIRCFSRFTLVDVWLFWCVYYAGGNACGGVSYMNILMRLLAVRKFAHYFPAYF